MVSRYYVLKGHEIVPTDDIREWGRMWDQPDGRIVARDSVGEVRVSTVFLGVDHNMGTGRVLLFETMTFGGDVDEWTWRYSTWDEAAAGHERIVAALRAGTDLPE